MLTKILGGLTNMHVLLCGKELQLILIKLLNLAALNTHKPCAYLDVFVLFCIDLQSCLALGFPLTIFL